MLIPQTVLKFLEWNNSFVWCAGSETSILKFYFFFLSGKDLKGVIDLIEERTNY